jgi:hypothetical protein
VIARIACLASIGVLALVAHEVHEVGELVRLLEVGGHRSPSPSVLRDAGMDRCGVTGDIRLLRKVSGDIYHDWPTVDARSSLTRLGNCPVFRLEAAMAAGAVEWMTPAKPASPGSSPRHRNSIGDPNARSLVSIVVA